MANRQLARHSSSPTENQQRRSRSPHWANRKSNGHFCGAARDRPRPIHSDEKRAWVRASASAGKSRPRANLWERGGQAGEKSSVASPARGRQGHRGQMIYPYFWNDGNVIRARSRSQGGIPRRGSRLQFAEIDEKSNRQLRFS